MKGTCKPGDPEVTVHVIHVKRSPSSPSPTSPNIPNGQDVSSTASTAGCTMAGAIDFYSILQPKNLFQERQSIKAKHLPDGLSSPTVPKVVPIALAVYEKVRAPSSTNGMFAELRSPADLADPLKIADKSFLIEFWEGQVGLMMISSKKRRPFLFLANGASDHGFEANNSEGYSGSRSVRNDEDMEVTFMWAESSDSTSVSPSLLLATMLLTARTETAMFLRTATGFGYAQVGDYIRSRFYFFKGHGNSLRCWECGVKKKAPCGKTERNDLPWCCHRRLGIFLHKFVVEFDNEDVKFSANGQCFLGLLPPRDSKKKRNPLDAQLRYQPDPSHVVSLSRVLLHKKPFHDRPNFCTALTRLRSKSRRFWHKIPWILDIMVKIKAGDENAANLLDHWLERNAYYKIPKPLQIATEDGFGEFLHDLVEHLLPRVELQDAPVLGNYDRNSESKEWLQDYDSSQESNELEPDCEDLYQAENPDRLSPTSLPRESLMVSLAKLISPAHQPQLQEAPHSVYPTNQARTLASFLLGSENWSLANNEQGEKGPNPAACSTAAGHKGKSGVSASMTNPSLATTSICFPSQVENPYQSKTPLTSNFNENSTYTSYEFGMVGSGVKFQPPADVRPSSSRLFPQQDVQATFPGNCGNLPLFAYGLGQQTSVHFPPQRALNAHFKWVQSIRSQLSQQSDAACNISPKPPTNESAILSSRSQSDPDYMPQKTQHISEIPHIPRPRNHASAENAHLIHRPNARSRERNNRSQRQQRLQFCPSLEPARKRAGLEPETRSKTRSSEFSDLPYQPKTQSSKRKRPSLPSSEEEKGTSSRDKEEFRRFAKTKPVGDLLDVLALAVQYRSEHD